MSGNQNQKKFSKIQKLIGITALILGASFLGLSVIAKRKKKDSVYADNPSQKNPMEGKKVVFIEDENDAENADGVRGHLEAVEDAENFQKSGFYHRYGKRAIDVIVSFFGLVFLSPIFLGIAIAIKIDDPGPVLFAQKRLGKNKQYFQLHKFRSMKMSAPHDVPTHQLKQPEQYLTRVGKFLRAHSLDELPQLWDIFLGNMSIIGPRPALWNQDLLVAEREKYGANQIKPGLSGWAQIHGRDAVEIQEKARLDGQYVKRGSLLFDIRCFFGTVGKVVQDDTVIEGGTGTMENNNTVHWNMAERFELPVPAETLSNLNLTEELHILIAGEGSYIGRSFQIYLSQWKNYQVDTFDTRTSKWKEISFSGYDVVYFVAGIAHIKETKENRYLYYKINRDLAVAIAEKAKKEGVKQFLYLSSMSVYGKVTGSINLSTVVCPVDSYGKSKWEAEQRLWQLRSEKFIVSIVRPPMVYGMGCKGNYQTLRKFAIHFPFFPEYKNQRSMLYIDNLSSAVRGMIHNKKSGVYFPQNLEYIQTYEMVKTITKAYGKKFYGIKWLHIPVKLAANKIKVFQKVFGTLVYDQKINVPEEWIAVKETQKSIYIAEGVFNSEQKEAEKNSKDIQPEKPILNVERKIEDKKNIQRKQNLNLNKETEQQVPLVTILTVSYQSENTIARTIESVLNQTYSNIEYIIVDGASKDKTVEVAKSYQKQFDKTKGRSLLIISEPDQGMYDALNKGAVLAHGKLVGQINADDFYEPDAVATMVKLYKKTHYDVAWGSIRVYKPTGCMIKHAKIGALWTTSGWCHPGMFSKREILLEFPYACKSMYDDFDFITTVWQAKKKIRTIDKVVSNFSFGGMSTKKEWKEVKKRVDLLTGIYRKHGMSKWYYFQRWGVELAKYLMG